MKSSFNVESTLKAYNETRYTYKNRDLQRIVNEIEMRQFIPNSEIERIIRGEHWKDFDNYCKNHYGIEHFWSTLQNLLFLHYYAPVKITFTMMQIALGIQQARWSVDPENAYQQKLTRELKPKDINDMYFLYYSDIEFTLFQDIESEQKYMILVELATDLHLEYETVEQHLQNTIWYTVSGNEGDEGGKSIFGSASCYGIPASYDFSTLTCIHQPIIVFGALTSRTMVRYILSENKRPYAGHMPGSASNLYDFDDIEAGILPNWYHDLFHQKKGANCDVATSVQRVADNCRKTKEELFGTVDIKHADWLNNPVVNECLTEPLSLELTDNGDIYQTYSKKGGKKKSKKGKKNLKRHTRRNRRFLLATSLLPFGRDYKGH